jgi:2-isopropylmalate synthase
MTTLRRPSRGGVAQFPTLVDTTVREGQQHGHVSFSPTQAVGLARLLDEFGIEMIEVGHPVVSEQDRKTAVAICHAGLRAQTLAHARATREDVEAAAAVGARWVGIFTGVNDLSLQHKLRRDRAAALSAIQEAVRSAKALGLQIRFTCEDASRTPLPHIIEVFEVARATGADRLSYADTVGVLTPATMRRVMRRLSRRFGDVLHAHCHNDFGLATANALAAIEAGAIAVDVSIEGIGERCGIAPLAEVALSLTQLYGAKARWNLPMLAELSAALRSCAADQALDTRPIVGRYACAHKAGLHIAAALQVPVAYESYPPELVGQRRQFLTSRLAGKHVGAVLHQRSVASLQDRPQPVKGRSRRHAMTANGNGYHQVLPPCATAQQNGRD